MHHKLKLYSIVKLKSDVIFLSDIRLPNGNVQNDSATQKISNTFLVNPYCAYNCYFNSSGNSRGVGILIKHSLNFTVDEAIFWHWLSPPTVSDFF
jgi:hypothetical protein